MDQNSNAVPNQKLLERLRTGAKNSKTVHELAQLVQDFFGPEEWTNYSIMFYFRKAFNLSFHQVKKMPGAFFMNGGLYTDEAIDQLIRPHIEEHYLNKQGKAPDELENQ